jgi:predicted amidohydrolase YtcJ
MTLTVFGGGTIRCGGGRPDTDALAVDDGRVVALGARARTLAARGGATTVDLDGDLLAPAFGDGHVHPMFAGLLRQGPAITGLTDVDAIVAEVGRWARANPDREWVVGGRYDPTLVPDGAFDARWLDEVVPDRPVVLDAADHHTLWCNSEALRRGGVDASTPDPETGGVVRRDDGSPLGTLREWQACDLVRRHVPEPTTQERVDALREATATLAAAGVTWAQDAWVDLPMVPAYLSAARDGALATRVDLALRLDPATWREQVPTFTDIAAQVAALQHPRLTARTVKVFVDGVIEGGTASMLRPYDDVDPCSAHARGMPVWQPDELAAALEAADAAGFRLHLHVIGDAAVRLGLDLLSGLPGSPGRDRRPVLAHAQLIDGADLDRFAADGVVVNCEPLWAAWDPMQAELTAPRLGPERTARQYPMASLLARGTRLSFGSDWPVTSHVPLEGIQVAVTRVPLQDPGAPPWVPGERLSVEQALDAYTCGVAYQAFAEQERGRLVEGAVADLVRLSDDPRAVDPLDIQWSGVRGIGLAGEPTWTAGR